MVHDYKRQQLINRSKRDVRHTAVLHQQSIYSLTEHLKWGITHDLFLVSTSCALNFFGYKVEQIIIVAHYLRCSKLKINHTGCQKKCIQLPQYKMSKSEAVVKARETPPLPHLEYAVMAVLRSGIFQRMRNQADLMNNMQVIHRTRPTATKF